MNTKKKKSSSTSSEEVVQILVENFVGLQKAMTNLSIKFESLSQNISSLLEVLELSAKTYLEKNKNLDENNDLIQRINYLIEQNKAIAEGLLLLEDNLRKKEEKITEKDKIPFTPKPLPKPE
ncbi:MAG: hypothetical protein QW273_02895 [Candidatus Pacearchaeota archaeon]